MEERRAASEGEEEDVEEVDASWSKEGEEDEVAREGEERKGNGKKQESRLEILIS